MMTNVLPPLQLSTVQVIAVRELFERSASVDELLSPGESRVVGPVETLVMMEYLYSLESPPEQPRYGIIRDPYV